MAHANLPAGQRGFSWAKSMAGEYISTSPAVRSFQREGHPSHLPDSSTRISWPGQKFWPPKPKSFLAVFSSIPSITPSAKEGTGLRSLGRKWMCHQSLQGLAASWDCTQNANRTQGTPPKGSHSRQSKKLFREVITTLTPKESGA